jgi:hypothetical protein
MGRFLEYDHGRRPSMKKYYPEPHHPSVSLLCKWIFGRMRERKITNTELNWLYSTLPGSQSTPLTYDQPVVLLSNIEFGRYWFGVLPLHVGYLFKTWYARNLNHLLAGTSLGFENMKKANI